MKSSSVQPRTALVGHRARFKAAVSSERLSLEAVLWWVPPLYAFVVSVTKLPPNSQILLPDARQFLAGSIHFHPGTWFGGDAREPLWMIANSVPVQIFGPEPRVLRMSSVVMFAFLVLGTQYLAREAVGPRIAIAVGFVLAWSDWLVLQALSGLREETAALGAVLLCLLAIRLRPGWSGPLLMGLVTGLSAMIRWDTLELTLPIMAVAFIQKRVPWVRVAASFATLAVIVVPYCVGNAQTFGDPFYQSNIHSVFFRNLEFGGQPGFPTKAQIAVNAFAGPSDTWAHYLFRLHSPRWVAKYSAEGTVDTALNDWTLTVLGPTQVAPPLALPTSSITAQQTTLVPWLLLFATVAGSFVLFTRRTWPITVALVLALIQHAPIQHLMDPRLGLAAVPFMVIAVAAALRWLWLSALERVGDQVATRRAQ